jgi:predicted MFS family arabinose efflux permease
VSTRASRRGCPQPSSPAVAATSSSRAYPGSGLLRYGPIRAVMVITALDSMSYAVLLAAVPLWQVQSGQTTSVAGLFTVAMLAATLITQSVVARLIDRAGTLRVQVCGLVALGLPAPLLSLSHQPEYDVVLCLVRGAGFGTVTVVGGILGATLVPRQQHGESVGLTGASASFAGLISLPISVALTHAGRFDLVACLGFAPVFGIYPAIILHRAPRRALDFKVSRPERRQSLRAIAAVTMSLFVITMALGATSTYLPLATREVGIATIGLFGMGATALLARLLIGRLVDRKGTAAVLPIATSIAASGIWLVAASVASRSTLGMVGVIAGCLVLGAGCGSVQTSTMVAVFAMVPQSSISTASAAWNFSYDIGSAVGVSAVSLSAEVRLGIAGGFSVLGLAILLTVPVRGSCRHVTNRI